MKLKIELANQPKNQIYTATDVVTGVVSMDVVKSLSISRLDIAIEGSLRSSEPIITDEAYPAISSYQKIIETSQTLFPRFPLSPYTRYTLGQGEQNYPFGIDLSLLLCYVDKSLLQSSYSKGHSWDPTRIFYTIRTTVKGSGCFRRRQNKATSLIAVRLDPPNIPWLLSRVRLPWQSFRVLPLDTSGNKLESQQEGDGFLPVYRPALFLTASIDDGFSRLRSGDFLGLRLWISVPLHVSEHFDLRLRSVCLSLINLSVQRTHQWKSLDLNGTMFASTQLDLPLKPNPGQSLIEVESYAWRSCELPQSMVTGKQVTDEGKEHLLQVLCEFSCNKNPDNTFTSVLIPVVVTTAILPSYHGNDKLG